MKNLDVGDLHELWALAQVPPGGSIEGAVLRMQEFLEKKTLNSIDAQGKLAPAAWYLQRVAPGRRDHGMKIGPFWKLQVAQELEDRDHKILPLYDETALIEKQSQIDGLAYALRFYAGDNRYRGPNQPPEGEDPYTPDDAAYTVDVTRDGGDIARKALASLCLSDNSGSKQHE